MLYNVIDGALEQTREMGVQIEITEGVSVIFNRTVVPFPPIGSIHYLRCVAGCTPLENFQVNYTDPVVPSI